MKRERQEKPMIDTVCFKFLFLIPQRLRGIGAFINIKPKNYKKKTA